MPNVKCKALTPAFVFVFLGLAGCDAQEKEYHYLVAKKVLEQKTMIASLTIVRRFEKMRWCEAEAESFNKNAEFTANCLGDRLTYELMFQGQAVGKWYVIRRIGRFSPTIIFYDFTPPLPDDIMMAQLKQIGPHTLQFAALHRAPAEVHIISPQGEVFK